MATTVPLRQANSAVARGSCSNTPSNSVQIRAAKDSQLATRGAIQASQNVRPRRPGQLSHSRSATPDNRAQPPIGNRGVKATQACNSSQDHDDANDVDGNEPEVSEDEGDNDEGNKGHPKRRRARTTNEDKKPSQLRFYSGPWVDVLVAAKHNYRLFINTEDPFPERGPESLEDAHHCLLKAISTFKAERKIPLDQGMFICQCSSAQSSNTCLAEVYNQYSSGMTALVSHEVHPVSDS